MVEVCLNGNIVGSINEVTLCRAGLVLKLVTVCSYTVLLPSQIEATLSNLAWSSSVCTSSGCGYC